jgi:hypothetical protein
MEAVVFIKNSMYGISDLYRQERPHAPTTASSPWFLVAPEICAPPTPKKEFGTKIHGDKPERCTAGTSHHRPASLASAEALQPGGVRVCSAAEHQRSLCEGVVCHSGNAHGEISHHDMRATRIFPCDGQDDNLHSATIDEGLSC